MMFCCQVHDILFFYWTTKLPLTLCWHAGEWVVPEILVNCSFKISNRTESSKHLRSTQDFTGCILSILG